MPRILIVDDESGIRESLSLALTEQGHEVDAAADVQEALAMMIRQPYHLVLTDLVMPKIDGLELIKTIRGKWGRQLPVIIITAHGSTEIASLALHAGVCDFILKPFDLATLTAAVRYALERARPSEQPSEPPAEQPAPEVEPAPAEAAVDFEKKFFGLSFMDELSRTVAVATEADKIGDTLLASVQAMLHPSRVVLAIYDRDRVALRFQRCQGGAEEQKLTAVDKIVLEWVMKSGQALEINDLERDPRLRACLAGIYVSGALLAIPLLRRNVALGGMILYRPAGAPAFGQDAGRVVSVLASMASIAFENAELYDELKTYFTGTIRALISTVEIKDPEHYGHSARVARASLILAQQAGLPEMDKRRLEYLALLHDIGKIGVPERVLQTRQLTPEEADMLNMHVFLGENIVRSIHFLPGGGQVVRAHHERFDGQGFPDGLLGETIPLFSRIIAIANAWDHLAGGDQALARARLQEASGHALDPRLVDLFLAGLPSL